MNIEILEKSGINYYGGLRRFLNDKALYESVIVTFLSDGCMSKAEKAFADSDYKTLFACAHELKGVCGNVDLTDIYKTSSALTEILRNGDFYEADVSKGFEDMKKAYDRTVEGIKRAMEE